MGGQLNYFGFWLDDDFGSGHSRGQPSCTTYGSPQLSAEEEFKLDKLEVWGVGVPSENEVSSITHGSLNNKCKAKKTTHACCDGKSSSGQHKNREFICRTSPLNTDFLASNFTHQQKKS